MSWFLIALIGPILYAISNHLDKLILSRYIRDDAADRWVLTAFSALFGGLMLPIAAFFHPDVFQLEAIEAIELMFIGSLLAIALSLYYAALQRDEASNVVPFYQTIPIFTYAAGFLILGEAMSSLQILGGSVIIVGALVLSFDRLNAQMRFKAGVAIPMLLASLLLSLNDVFFKLFALETGFWTSVFWTYAGSCIAGLVIISDADTRALFIEYVSRNNIRGISAASVSETLFVIAEVVMHYASLLAPVVLVSLVNAFQPGFVFAIGILLTVFYPTLGTESLSKGALAQKLAALALLAAGTFMIGS